MNFTEFPVWKTSHFVRFMEYISYVIFLLSRKQASLDHDMLVTHLLLLFNINSVHEFLFSLKIAVLSYDSTKKIG